MVGLFIPCAISEMPHLIQYKKKTDEKATSESIKSRRILTGTIGFWTVPIIMGFIITLLLVLYLHTEYKVDPSLIWGNEMSKKSLITLILIFIIPTGIFSFIGSFLMKKEKCSRFLAVASLILAITSVSLSIGSITYVMIDRSNGELNQNELGPTTTLDDLTRVTRYQGSDVIIRDPVPALYTDVIEGNCSTKCISGTKTTTTIICTFKSEFSCTTTQSSKACTVKDDSCEGLDLSDLSDWTQWSECSASCISDDFFPMKIRKRCKLHATGKECVEEAQQCMGYHPCPLDCEGNVVLTDLQESLKITATKFQNVKRKRLPIRNTNFKIAKVEGSCLWRVWSAKRGGKFAILTNGFNDPGFIIRAIELLD